MRDIGLLFIFLAYAAALFSQELTVFIEPYLPALLK